MPALLYGDVAAAAAGAAGAAAAADGAAVYSIGNLMINNQLSFIS